MLFSYDCFNMIAVVLDFGRLVDITFENAFKYAEKKKEKKKG